VNSETSSFVLRLYDLPADSFVLNMVTRRQKPVLRIFIPEPTLA